MNDVIVIGSNYTTALGIVKSVGEAGFGVRFLALSEDCLTVVANSRYVTASVFCEDEPESMIKGLERLRKGCGKLLVIPTSDSSTMFLDQHAADLREHFYFPNIDDGPGKLAAFMDKERQKILAAQCGLNVAEGKDYSTDDEGIKAAVSEIVFPCIIKASSSTICLRSKDVFAVCGGASELENAMRAAARKNCPVVMVERYLEAEKDLAAYGVSYDGRVVMPAVVDTLRSGHGSHKGVTAEGIMYPADILGEDRARFEDLVRASGLNGLFCIDIIRCEGKNYFVEMNLRYGSSGYAVTIGGADLPGMLARAVTEGLPLDESAAMRREVHFINEKVELDDFRAGYISWAEYRENLSKDISFFIRDEKDPGPWKKFKTVEMKRRIAKLVKGISSHRKA